MATLAEFTALAAAEYRWLRDRLDLRPVPLKVILHDESPAPAYGGNPRCIVFPVSEADLDIVHDLSATSTVPRTWELRAWDPWRVFLWHEVAHQFQDEHGFGWNPKDQFSGHPEPMWSRVADAVAARVGCPDARLLHAILASSDTGSYSPP